MKKNTHPPYQEVLFIDSSNGSKFVVGSTLQPKEKAEHEGKEYPVVHVSTSSSSHPFYTGSNQFIDSEGRVDRFRNRYKKKQDEITEEKKRIEEVKAASKKKKKK